MEIPCFTKKTLLWAYIFFIGVTFSPFTLPTAYAQTEIPLYGLFEISVVNNTSYNNPFADVELNAEFTSPTGRKVQFFGFYDGDGNGGQNGNVWKQRFMPDEVGTWSYEITFSDANPGATGSFDCVLNGAKPGPWKQNPNNKRWLLTARGDHFLPTAFFAVASLTPIDWQDAIDWAVSKGYNTLVTQTYNPRRWGDGWKNVTPFLATDTEAKIVDLDRFNIPMWREWDDMFEAAGNMGLYIAPFRGPDGDYGGQSGVGTVVPPDGFVYLPSSDPKDYDTPRNLRVIKYYVARRAAYWNMAYWALSGTEVFEDKPKSEVLAYGEYFASITPFGRMISSQDIEQYQNGEFDKPNRKWLAEMNFPDSRKINTVQGGQPKGNRVPKRKTQ